MKETFRTIHLHKRSTVNRKLFTVNRKLFTVNCKLYTAPLLRLALIAALSLLMLAACTTDGGRRAVYLSVLDRAQQQNVSFDSITNVDSIQLAADFFDRHGTPNERMRAHYLLGCAYRDMGDAPRALEYYQEAISSADTLAVSCDIVQLYKVYGQVAELLYMQNMPNEVINAYEKVYEIAMAAKDTIPAYLALYHKADAYDLMEKTDSVSSICKRTYRLFMNKKRKDLAACSLFMLIFAELKTGDYSNAHKHIVEYEKESGISDHHEQNWNYGMLSYAKGLYALGINDLVKAEQCFREELAISTDVDNLHAAFDGLRKVFQAKHVPDSTAKYAVLSADYNDSIYHQMNTKNLQQMEAAYNYNIHKEESIRMKRQAERIKSVTRILLVSIMLVIIFSVLLLLYQRKRKKEEREKFLLTTENDLLRLEQAQTDMRLMREMHDVDHNTIAEKNHQIAILQQRIEHLNRKMENSKKGTLEERLTNSDIYYRFRALMTKINDRPSLDDWRGLHSLFNKEHPSFYTKLNESYQLSQFEYDMCLLTRLHFKPAEIAVLMNCDRSTVSVTRSRLLKKCLGIEGKAKDFDDYLFSI